MFSTIFRGFRLGMEEGGGRDGAQAGGSAVEDEQLNDEPIKLPDGRRVQCPICSAVLAHTKSYWNHKTTQHGITPKVSGTCLSIRGEDNPLLQATVKCPVDGCAHGATTIDTLCLHMAAEHQFEPQPWEDDYDSLEEFEVCFNLEFHRHLFICRYLSRVTNRRRMWRSSDTRTRRPALFGSTATDRGTEIRE